MPVRNKAVESMAHRRLPGVWFSYGEPSDGRWPEVVVECDKVYQQFVENIDWTRVLLEASGRHLAFNHGTDRGDPLHLDDDDEAPCGECVQAALLCDDTWPNWQDQAIAEGWRDPVSVY